MVLAVTRPDCPVLELPAGVKVGPRADFRVTEFDVAIETMGYLLAWNRALPCPCSPIGAGSTQPDPNCTLCHGRGWLYFGAHTPQALGAYQFDGVQQHLIDRDQAMVIRGIVTSVSTRPTPWDRLSNWVPGSLQVTVRAPNTLGIFDRLVALDSQVVYAETVAADGSTVLPLRYPVCGVNLIRSTTRVYQADADYRVSDQGTVEWFDASKPAQGTRLSAHYLCHPTWVVMEHPHVMRLSQVQQKVAHPKTPLGDPKYLPIQAVIRLEFLPEPVGVSDA